jgi:hypothetical protein
MAGLRGRCAIVAIAVCCQINPAHLLVATVASESQSMPQPADSSKPRYTRVRSDDRYLIGLIRRGYDRSPTFRVLVDPLQHSNVIAFVQPGMCAGGRIRSCLVAVAASERDRHVRIRVAMRHTIENGLIAAVGHALQHAVEVAERLEVVDSASLSALYRRIATSRCGQGLSDECETERALATERTIYLELSAATGGLPPRRSNARGCLR